MKRDQRGPNTFSQAIKDLQPGRLYSMKMLTCEYEDLVKPKKKTREEANKFIGTVTLENVEIDSKRSFEEMYSSSPEPEIPVWITYHWKVFRAKDTTAKLTVSDWPNDKEIVISGGNRSSTLLKSSHTTNSKDCTDDAGRSLRNVFSFAIRGGVAAERIAGNTVQLEIWRGCALPMNVVPILTRELHCLNWRRTFYRQRLSVGMTASTVLLALVLVDRFGGGISLMRMGILGPVLGILPFMVFILGLHGASELLAMERREGTLPLLLMTRVSGWDIIFGKLWQAVFTQGAVSLAAVPGLVLPLLAMGMGYTEFCYLVLAYANVVFFSLALGLLGAVFTDTRSAASWCLFFFLPVLVYSTPFTMFLPGGKLMQELALLQWVNPCAAVAQAPSAAAGFRSARFWEYLLVSHGVAWLLAGAAGWLLPFTTRHLAGRTQTRRWSWFRRQRTSSFEMRAPLLERNPFLWPEQPGLVGAKDCLALGSNSGRDVGLVYLDDLGVASAECGGGIRDRDRGDVANCVALHGSSASGAADPLGPVKRRI
jgi:hypothetical protein